VIPQKQQIIIKAHELFMRYGFKAVTVDEIAKACGISKKTLYEHYNDKKQIIFETLSYMDNVYQEKERQTMQHAANAIEEGLFVMHEIEKDLMSMNANCIPDLQKYYPEAFLAFNNNCQAQINTLKKHLKRGIKEGYFRKTINVDFCAWYRMNTVMMLFQNPEFSSKFDIVKAQTMIAKQFLYGISTVEGHKVIEENIQKLNKIKK
jgi:TetR/AcrR family transcriptional regulator, cholesterol catabolism regulator